MLTRDFNVKTISSKINDIKESSTDIFNKTKEVLQKKYSLNDITGKIPDTVNPEVNKILNQTCSSNRYGRGSDDYLGNLNRLLNDTNRLDLCNDGKKLFGEGDTLLSTISKLRSGSKIDVGPLVKNFVGNELNSLGFAGSVPQCLLDSLLNKINGIFNMPGNLIPKIDMSKLLNNKCLKDMANFGIGQVDNMMRGAMVDTMSTQGNSSMTKGYVKSLFDRDSKSTVNMLENNISAKNGKGTFEQYSILSGYSSKINVNKGNLLNNLNNDKINSSVFRNLDNHINSKDMSLFKGQSNLNNMASKYISSSKPNSTIGSISNSSLSSASLSRIANLF